MKFSEPIFYKQVRSDGSEYYYASVKVTYRWFFGLLTWSFIYNLHKGTDTYYLINHDEHYHFFTSLDEAKKRMKSAIENEIMDYNRKRVVSVTKVE